jgi:hypothetical protein
MAVALQTTISFKDSLSLLFLSFLPSLIIPERMQGLRVKCKTCHQATIDEDTAFMTFGSKDGVDKYCLPRHPHNIDGLREVPSKV